MKSIKQAMKSLRREEGDGYAWGGGGLLTVILVVILLVIIF